MSPSSKSAAASKFTFDTEFRADADVVSTAARKRQKQTMSVEDIEAMLSRAQQEGLESGQVQAQEKINQTLAALVISLRAALDQSLAEIEAVREEATHLAIAAARKLAHAALEALPTGDVEAALREAMHQAIGEPRITLKAASDVIDALKERVETIAHEEGYEGRVLIAAEPALKSADCRIEWRGGGSERNEAAITAALEALIARRFSQSDSSVNLKG